MIYLLFNHTKQMLALIVIGQVMLRVPFCGSFLSRFFEYVIRVLFASDISCKAKIPRDVIFVHGHDIVIGADVVIGRGCKIFNGVTLGNKDTETTFNSQPVVGNFCVLSTGAKILGGVKIGDRSIVGANAVVIRDVPPDSIAVGVPAKNKPRHTQR
jgi:serine O-acetyltransferase